MSKFIFVTGGVVSGLGKGITTASVGLILKTCGLEVDVIKFDPYLNIDPGTMSPYEHGEVYVLQDGSETDLDLGHYERFLNTNLDKNSSVTAGKIYDTILNKEREGDYLGKNVQLIPHVTNFIKSCLIRGLNSKISDKKVRLIEIGGSTGDMEGEIFLESFRQFKIAHKDQTLHIHLGYVPYLKCSGEYKTKPLQNSVREMLKSGLQPDVLVARYTIEENKKFNKELLEKIALFGNLPVQNVLALPDLESIYQVPVFLQESPLIKILEDFTKIKSLNPNLPSFYNKINLPNQPKKVVKIAIIAKYPKLTDAYLSLTESLKIAAVQADVIVENIFVEAESLEKNPKETEKSSREWKKLENCQAIIIPGGFGVRGMEGKILACKYARENNIPFLGICLGLQMAVVEFARNICNLNAYSKEMLEKETDQEINKDIVIDLIPEQKTIHKKGGTMRLGAYDCQIEKNTLAYNLFAKTTFNKNLDKDLPVIIQERHRHRLEVENKFVSTLEENGLKISGKHFYKNSEGHKKFLVELIELNTKIHPYFIATQSHPEFLSRPDLPHPLFFGLIKATLEK
jgi:CTP synthase